MLETCNYNNSDMTWRQHNSCDGKVVGCKAVCHEVSLSLPSASDVHTSSGPCMRMKLSRPPLLPSTCHSCVGLSNTSILYCILMWDKILRQILDIDILWYGVSVVFSWLKRFHYSEVMRFSELTRLFSWLFYLPLPTYPHYRWLFIKKCHWVSILWNHQKSFL